MAKKRRARVDFEFEADPDRLGKLVAEYRPNPGAIFGLALLLLLGGIGLLVYCQFQTPYPWKLMLPAVVLIILAPVVVAINIMNFGRVLQVYRHGVRFTEGGVTEEFTWDEVTDVDVQRTDVKQMGVVTARTEWTVTIHGPAGRRIHLSPVFLQHVPDVRKLVTLLRMHTQ